MLFPMEQQESLPFFPSIPLVPSATQQILKNRFQYDLTTELNPCLPVANRMFQPLYPASVTIKRKYSNASRSTMKIIISSTRDNQKMVSLLVGYLFSRRVQACQLEILYR